MGTYPTSPRSDFLNWCLAHVEPFTASAAAIGLSTQAAADFKTAAVQAQDAVLAQEQARQAAKAATDMADQALADLRKITAETVGTIKIFAESTRDPVVYVKAQIPPPAPPAPVPAPGQPKDMAVAIAPGTGAITLKWKCDNPANASGTSYVVRRKLPSQQTFEFLGVSGKKTFTDTTFTAGPDTVQYTVQAVRSDKSGPVSDILVLNFGAAPTAVGAAAMTFKMAA